MVLSLYQKSEKFPKFADVDLWISISIFLIGISMLTSIGLIYAVVKENQKLMLLWIFHESVSLTFYGVFVVFNIILFLDTCFILLTPYFDYK